MKFYEIMFSPTGGTKKAADILSRSLTQQVIEVDLCVTGMLFFQKYRLQRTILP